MGCGREVLRRAGLFRPERPTRCSSGNAAPSHPEGLKVVIEVTAYREGAKVAVGTAIIEGSKRTIRQHESLMFNDIDEAQDAVDALLDRVTQEAKKT